MADAKFRKLLDTVAGTRSGDDLWYCELIIGLIACNHGELGPLVYEKALSLAQDQKARQNVFTRIRETMLKAIFPLGQAKVLALELAIVKVVKPEDISSEEIPLRDWTNDELGRSKAMNWLSTINAAVVDNVIPPVEQTFPELFHYAVTLSSGHVMAEDRILSMVETERLVLIALTAQGVGWWAQSHYCALFRMGGSKEMAYAANSLALELAEAFDMKVEGTANIDELYESVRAEKP